jgi:hypothetical protein
MRRHKQHYFEQVEVNPNLYRIVMIRRKPKKRSRIRKCMYWAWQLQSDKQFIKKYYKDETDGYISN